jgi:hypothetical protein
VRLRLVERTASALVKKIKDENVINALTQPGVSIDRWLALGSYLVGYLDENGQLMAHVIENDALAAAASKLLQKPGQTHQINVIERPM